jgi:hypothetical protein
LALSGIRFQKREEEEEEVVVVEEEGLYLRLETREGVEERLYSLSRADTLAVRIRGTALPGTYQSLARCFA